MLKPDTLANLAAEITPSLWHLSMVILLSLLNYGLEQDRRDRLRSHVAVRTRQRFLQAQSRVHQLFLNRKAHRSNGPFLSQKLQAGFCRECLEDAHYHE